MSIGDWTNVVVGLTSLYFLWQQNQIFRRQNEIFAVQAGASKMPSESAKLRIWRYWPMLAMSVMTLGMWAAVAYDIYDRHSITDSKRWLSRDAELPIIYAHSYLNEAIEIDGKKFDRCSFENVKLIFHGTQPTNFRQCRFIPVSTDSPTVRLMTDNVAIKNYMIVLAYARHFVTGKVESVGIDEHGNAVPFGNLCDPLPAPVH